MTHMNIKLNDLQSQWQAIKEKATPEIFDYLASGEYIGSHYVERFENAWSDYVNLKHSVMVSSGTDAYKLALASLRLDSDTCVLLQNNTWATILFETKRFGYYVDCIDCDSHFQYSVSKLKSWLKSFRSKYKNVVLVPTHMLGHPCDMKEIMTLAADYDCSVIEDCSQAHGAYCDIGSVGQFSDVAFWSLYPGKNLGAVSEAGIVSTDDEVIAGTIRELSNCGMESKNNFAWEGYNSRPCGLSSIALYHKLNKLEEWNTRRIKIADVYKKYLYDNTAKYCTRNVYHYFPVLLGAQRRDDLTTHLDRSGVPYCINYPFTIAKLNKSHKMFSYLKSTSFSESMVCLPCHPFMDEDQASSIAKTLKCVKLWDL